MPPTTVVFFQHEPEDVPVLDWLVALRKKDRRAYSKCAARIGRLAEAGHELRRPETAFVQKGLHELRIRRGRIHYRILYFFHGRDMAVLTLGLIKEGRIPDGDIQRAQRNKAEFERDPEAHTHEMVVR
jgi:phage-related protein